jgi:glycosyltransferase involved in cell wall biosynthesis
MRIAVASQFYTPVRFGGAEVSTQYLCEALTRRGHEVHVITTRLPGLTNGDVINGVRVSRADWGNVYAWDGGARPAPLRLIWHGVDTWNPKARSIAFAWLENCRPDVFHTNTLAGISCSIWGSAKSLGIPIVHTLRDYYLMCPKSSMFKGGLNCPEQCYPCAGLSFPKRLASNHVGAVVGNSAFILNRHCEAGYFRKAVTRRVIHNISGFHLDGHENHPAFPAKPLRVGFLGRLDRSKGLETLLKAAEKISEAKIAVKIGGEGDPTYEKWLREHFTRPNVQFLGRVSAQDFLRAVDLLVVPSLWHDPLPRVIFEAYAAGVPVICSDRGGSKEIVADAASGFLFNGGDADELSALLMRIADEKGLLSKLRSGAAERASSFTADVITSAYESVYAQVCGR